MLLGLFSSVPCMTSMDSSTSPLYHCIKYTIVCSADRILDLGGFQIFLTDYAICKPNLKRNFAVGFSTMEKWKTDNMLQGSDTVFSSDGSKMVFLDRDNLAGWYGLPGFGNVFQAEMLPI